MTEDQREDLGIEGGYVRARWRGDAGTRYVRHLPRGDALNVSGQTGRAAIVMRTVRRVVKYRLAALALRAGDRQVRLMQRIKVTGTVQQRRAAARR